MIPSEKLNSSFLPIDEALLDTTAPDQSGPD